MSFKIIKSILSGIKMKFIFPSIFCLLPLIVESQVTDIKENPKNIEIQSENYSIKITKSPIGLSIIRNNQVVASISEENGITFQVDGKIVSLKNVEKWTNNGNVIDLVVATNYKVVKSNIKLKIENDRIYFNWQQVDLIPVENMTLSFSTKYGKHWYGGPVVSGHNWPLETAQNSYDPQIASSNQSTPFWLTASGIGLYMPTYEPMGFKTNYPTEGRFDVFMKKSNKLDIQILIGKEISDVYKIFAKTVGLPRTVPPKGYFSKPMFNTWIEFLENINQKKLLDFAQNIRKEHFACEVLMIDAGWTTDKDNFEFDKEKFPDPKGMMDELHKMNFKVLLWVSPYISSASNDFSYLSSNNYFIKDEKGIKPGTITWWGGSDYEIDMSNPLAFNWVLTKMKNLQNNYGVDGFKQDGGDSEYIPMNYKTFNDATPNKSTDYWANLGDHFQYNEYRVSWMKQSSGLVQRLRDKHNNWTISKGLGSLIPHGIASSMIGYSYFCPDMIGGGDSKDFCDPNYKGMGTELFIRWTQASALMPMMQFSYAPWNLDEKAVGICRKYSELHQQFGEYIYELAKNTAITGDPIIRPLYYNYTEDENTYKIDDQFILGDRYLVAPVVVKGAIARNIYLPKGQWKDYWTGEIYLGGKELKNFSAPLEVLPLFVKID